MEHFPVFMNVSGRVILVCGEGRHAEEKLERLRPFDACVRWIPQGLGEEELLNWDPVFVVTASTPEENRRIAALCRAHRIPVNAVDQRDSCDFYFPAMAVGRNYCAAICTDGKSPAVAAELRARMEEQIPEDLDGILDWLQSLRGRVNRQTLCAAARNAMNLGRPLSDLELEKIVAESTK